MKIVTPSRTEIDVRRPDGRIETVDMTSKFPYLNDILFQKMIEVNRNTGRGDVLRFRNIDAVVEMEESDYEQKCERCGTKLDSRKAYSQKEWGRFGSQKVRVSAYYCDTCRDLLSSIGVGEITDMEHRTGYVPSYEPTTKED